MESFNNSNNMNIELAQQQKKFQKIKNILRKALKCINKKVASKKIAEETRSEVDDNNFNEMLEQRMEAQQNLINEQIIGKQEQESTYCFVENEHGKFYWSSNINRFVAVDCDLIPSAFCESSHQQAQIQCC